MPPLYPVIANCHAQGLDPEDYQAEALKRLPHEATVEQAVALTPRSIAAERQARAAAEAEQIA